jgi:hypothetical protein
VARLNPFKAKKRVLQGDQSESRIKAQLIGAETDREDFFVLPLTGNYVSELERHYLRHSPLSTSDFMTFPGLSCHAAAPGASGLARHGCKMTVTA